MPTEPEKPAEKTTTAATSVVPGEPATRSGYNRITGTFLFLKNPIFNDGAIPGSALSLGAGDIPYSALDISDGSIPEAKLTNNGLLARVADAETITGDWTFDSLVEFLQVPTFPDASIPYAKLNIADGTIPSAKLSEVRVGGDPGGLVGKFTLTNVKATINTTGDAVIKHGTPGLAQSGWYKFYDDTGTPGWVPFWATT